MLHSRWFRKLLGTGPSYKNRRRTMRSRKPARPMLESLEERLTPSGGNPTVTQTAGGYTALTGLVQSDTAANTNYIIEITGSFTFNSGGQVSISKLGAGSTLTLEGQNGTNFTLTGNGNRLFTVGSSQNVTFKDLTLTGGAVDGSSTGTAQGGGLFDDGGTVTLSKVAVQNNKVTQGAAEGGGIYVADGSTLTIQGGSTIRSNSAVNGTASAAHHFSNLDYGGGLYVYGASTVTIIDSSISNNTAHAGRGNDAAAAGQSGGIGGQARGGGLYVGGLNWNVTLRGDTLSGNSVIGGDGGKGAAGSDATAANSSGGNGGDGGTAQEADGGGGYFVVRNDSGLGSGTGTLAILNDATNPSLIVNNSVQAGTGGNGGNGGTSTGAADNSNGGQGGQAGLALGGGLIFYTFGNTLNAQIGNTTIYGNTITGGNGGTGAAAGTGGSGKAGTPGSDAAGAGTLGGGIEIGGGNVTIVNSTIAHNTSTGGTGAGGQKGVMGGGIDEGTPGSVILDNNTITQNTLNGASNFGAGIALLGGNPSLFNNLIQGNQGSNSSGNDVDSYLKTLANATNNFIGTSSANAVNSQTNIVGNSQAQLGSVVGVDADGKPSGGPIYYPLLPGSVSLGAGTTSVLSTIAAVEGTTPDNATDEIGNPRTSSGTIDIGAIQTVVAPTISSNPNSLAVMAGQTATFTASASGSPTPAVQWQVSTDDGKTFHDMSGATSLTLTLNNVQTSMSGYEYQAVFTNSAGSVPTSAATLTVNPVPPPPPPPPHAPPAPPAPPPAPPALNVPPFLGLLNHYLGGVETVNANGTETITDILFGFHLFVSTFDASGNLMSVTLFGFNVTFLFV